MSKIEYGLRANGKACAKACEKFNLRELNFNTDTVTCTLKNWPTPGPQPPPKFSYEFVCGYVVGRPEKQTTQTTTTTKRMKQSVGPVLVGTSSANSGATK